MRMLAWLMKVDSAFTFTPAAIITHAHPCRHAWRVGGSPQAATARESLTLSRDARFLAPSVRTALADRRNLQEPG
jgi:hypothetical protein